MRELLRKLYHFVQLEISFKEDNPIGSTKNVGYARGYGTVNKIRMVFKMAKVIHAYRTLRYMIVRVN